MPNIGKVASGTSSTAFTVNAATGAVGVGSGGAQFVPSNATRTSLTTITINCSGGKKCGSNNVQIKLTAGSATGRLGAISGWGVDFTGTTAVLVSGSTTCTCSSLTFVIRPVAASNATSGSATFHLGLTVPVNTSGTLGTATSAYSVEASGTGYTTGTGAASVRSTVEGKLGMQKASDLNYGRIVLIANQSGVMVWDAANQSLTYSPAGFVVQKGATSIAAFTVTGTPGQNINFEITNNAGLPNYIRLKNQNDKPLDITISTTAQSSQTILPTGVFPFYVGGALNISPGMYTGAYSGNFTITVSYQ